MDSAVVGNVTPFTIKGVTSMGSTDGGGGKSSLFIEHLEDASPTEEQLEAFDCFSPGSYLWIRQNEQRQQQISFIHSPGSPSLSPSETFPLSSSPPLSDAAKATQAETITINATPERFSPHARAHPSPFAALVRRISYTSSHHAQRKAAAQGRRHREQTSSYKRPKSSSGPIGQQQSHKYGGQLRSSADYTAPALPPADVGTRFPRVKPTWPLSSPSLDFLDNDTLKGSGSGTGAFYQEETSAADTARFNAHAGAGRNSVDTPPRRSSRSSSSGEDFEAQLGRHTNKRMSMPNLAIAPTLAASSTLTSGMNSYFPPTHEYIGTPGGHGGGAMDMVRPDHVQQRRMSFDALREQNRSPSINLRSPSPLRASTTLDSSSIQAEQAGQDEEVNNLSPSGPLTSIDQLKPRPVRHSSNSRRESSGWLWNRRSSHSSLNGPTSPRPDSTSTAYSPRFRPGALSPSPSFMVLNKASHGPLSPSVTGGLASPGSPRDRTPSPSALLRSSPLSHLPTPNGDMSPSSLRPSAYVTPRRSLSASVLQLGRKVASFGNSVSVNAHQSALASSSRPSTSHTSEVSSPNAGIDDAHNATPASLTAFPANDEHGHRLEPETFVSAEVPWTFKVHRVYDTTPGTASSPSTGVGMVQPTENGICTETLSVQHRGLSRSSVPIEDAPIKMAMPVSPCGQLEGPLEGHGQDNSAADDVEVVSQEPNACLALSPRPRLSRSAKSDDAYTRPGINLIPSESNDSISSSAPSPSAFRQRPSGFVSPGRQPSPVPSRDLTLISEADECPSPTRPKEWHASLRGRPRGSRRLSAADLFSTGANSKVMDPNRKIFPAVDPDETAHTNSANLAISSEIPPPADVSLEQGLDFSKRPVPLLVGMSQLSPTVHRPYHADNTSVDGVSHAIRSRATSQSSLLSRSRPETPASSTPLQGLSPMMQISVPYAVEQGKAAALPFQIVPQRRAHRHTLSLPGGAMHDPVHDITGLGAPESSVLAASHARFARVLMAAASTATPQVVNSTPYAEDSDCQGSAPASDPSVGRDEKRKELRQLMMQSAELGSAVSDDDESSPVEKPAHLPAVNAIRPISHDAQRVPRLSYGTTASADSQWSKSSVIGGPSLPMAPTSTEPGLSDGSGQASGSSGQPASSMSNARDLVTAIDVFLAGSPSRKINGLPNDPISSGLSRKEISDDSTLEYAANQAEY